MSEQSAPKKTNSRRIAAQILLRVLEHGQSLTEALAAELPSLSGQDRAFAQALSYGVLRHYGALDARLRQLTHKPIQVAEVRILALLGLLQLNYLAVKPHAAVAETVAAAARYVWAKPLLNAVLRNNLRRAAELDALELDNVGRYSHPAWLIERMQADWPAHWQALLDAGNQAPPMTLRVNRRVISRADYLTRLADNGLAAQAAPSSDGVVLAQPTEVHALPGFAEGWVSVQDAAAQWAAPLLDLQPGQRVLDACAAPGGKTAHLLECGVDLKVVALDADAARAARIHDNLARLNLSAQVQVGDAGRPTDWWDGQVFDRILLDAPCSATGVIRRHPDIKWLRRAHDIEALADTQLRLLTALWPLLAPGGVLLYATCSILRQENSEVIARFIAQQPDAEHCPLNVVWGVELPYGRQILSGQDGMDGFYYARLNKRA